MKKYATACRGSTIVVALLITAVLATLAVSLLGRRVAEKSVVNSRFVNARAEALAWAGLENARVKLMNSRDFPPTSSFANTSFSYSEQLSDGGQPVGVYAVQVDLRNKDKAVIRSTAQLTDQPGPTLMIRAELDTEQERKSYAMDATEGTESRPFQWIRVEAFDVQAAQ